MERVLALELGADDALSRPFSPRELLARVRAVLRRSRRAPRGEPKPLRVGEWLFEPATRCLRRGACVQMLGAVEFLLLSELTSHPGVALSREHLLEVSHPQRRPASARAVDSAIVRLRKLIEPEPRRPRCLRTVRGAGYAFEPRADDAASARSADFTAPALECVAASRARASECAASARRP
jgi:two-component system phosphate regulon response regulator OmpR